MKLIKVTHHILYFGSGIIDILQGIVISLSFGFIKLNWSIRYAALSARITIAMRINNEPK